jgi:hypothetical protein
MPCSSCGSHNLEKFTGNVAIRFAGPENIDQRAVFAVPELMICWACGFAEFAVPSDPLRALAKRNA